MRILYAGTPAFAVPALEVLIESADWRPAAVLTQPDRGAGRGRRVRFGPVKQRALDAGIEVLQPVSLKQPEVQSLLAECRPDLLVTAAYGLILPQAVLDLPQYGCWNLHASLLPRWRGASPINQAILAGDAESGVSLMQMEAGLDTGPVILQRATPIGTDETAGELHDRLAELAAEVLVEGLSRLEQGRLPSPQPQDEAAATHAPLIDKHDARLDWQRPAVELARMVRAYHPWPVAFGEIEGVTWRIHRARPGEGRAAPGELLPARGPDVVAIGCGEGVLEILELQGPGRKPVAARDWFNARRGKA
ncbi:methionyl-tRNA formyltransferase [Wenzhouxiangella sp. XN201]|uniref:methionyl-tRNA formyltransferase n=1 Tax=Wenzhouxiangella sp. XN201 TaxID=2710755 RepID=UPI0013CC7239|nr:methionyl-tRNA formyltransferase [Wenzhouxiangella sp. XN201]NEZ04462.1 methionyl-tRNA formyltransferase [Wenzhouxiangella sp. XN201]